MSDLSRQRLVSLVESFAGIKVLVIGDLMLDEYLNGAVTRVSPEAPVPVVDLQERLQKPGGAANVALNLLKLGAQVELVGLVGRDDAGTALLGALETSGLSTRGTVVSPNRRTTRKARVMSGGQQLLRVDTEDQYAATPEEEQLLADRVRHLIQDSVPQAIVFEDYDKGTLTPALIEQFVVLAEQLSVKTVVDPKVRNFWAYQNVSLLKPNLKELATALHDATLSSRFPEFGALAEGHQRAADKLGHVRTLVTLGAEGAFLGGESSFHLPALPLNIVDVCGAGDSVAAASTLALVAGATPQELLFLANLAGGLTCEFIGVHAISKDELTAGIDEHLTQLASASSRT